ncbi:hypothetical protein T440DRAFT_466326 [Plenodomus tracheiphilus IPT5]|uniref:F-box domain-containing protein n=1 Tax=Plenodomus tracheiphilus IPT5 TaxID=1408161 RepID=A0A6A7BED3_9PLEO|nr:hypothetical protein T440DRAFT_466326 [Plenodomus tracheiphilus IPT5]
MALLDLPPDVKIGIAEHLDPDNCLALALTCSELHSCIQDVLSVHTRLLAENSIIDATGADPVLWTVLTDILEEPRKGWYVRELNLPSSCQEQRQDPLSDAELDLFMSATQALAPIYPRPPEPRRDDHSYHLSDSSDSDPVSHVGNALVNGDVNVAIVLLVHHLPNLQTIRITDYHLGLFADFLEHWAVARTSPPSTLKLPFRRLKSASIAHWDTEGSCNFKWATNFMHAPVIDTIAAQSMGGGHVMLPCWSVAFLRNKIGHNLKELYFTCSQLDLQKLDVVLEGIAALERFTYDSGGAIVDDQPFRPKRILAALVMHAGHSLQKLVLTDFTDDNIPSNRVFRSEADRDLDSVPIRDFRNLKILRCNYEWLLPTEGMTDVESSDSGLDCDDAAAAAMPIFDVRDVLPKSLEKLHLHGQFDDDEWTQTRETLGVSNVSTPNLSLGSMRVTRLRPRDVIGAATKLARTEVHRLIRGHGP